MTKKSHATRLKLQQDIESYLCGEVPSPLDMKRAATLDHWETSLGRRGKEFALFLRGEVSQHPKIADGQLISTSAVVWFDRHARFCRTVNRLYALGDQAGAPRW